MKKILWSLVLIMMSVTMWSQQTDGVIRVLAVGNSFSRDAIEQNLWDLAAADGQRCVVGNMYVPGCPISLHVENARRDSAMYEFCLIGVDGQRIRKQHTRLDEALRCEPWDVVTVQQASYESGNYDSFRQLDELVSYIRARVPKSCKVMFHQTWAYAKDSKHGGFKRYGNSQQTMYEAIVDCAERAVKDFGLEGLIPAGTAVQLARQTVLGDNLNVDGHHLNEVGKYTAACTWYEYVFGRKVKGNGYCPRELNKKQRKLAQKSAHKACCQQKRKWLK